MKRTLVVVISLLIISALAFLARVGRPDLKARQFPQPSSSKPRERSAVRENLGESTVSTQISRPEPSPQRDRGFPSKIIHSLLEKDVAELRRVIETSTSEKEVTAAIYILRNSYPIEAAEIRCLWDVLARHRDEEILEEALRSLSLAKRGFSAEPILALYRGSPSPRVRAAAVACLGRHLDEEAMKPFRAHFDQEEDAGVREAIARSFGS